VGNSSSLRIKMEISVLQIKIFFLKMRLGKHKGIFPLIIPVALVGLKIVDIMLNKRKKK